MPYVQKAMLFSGSDEYEVSLRYNNFIATNLNFMIGEKVLNTQMTAVSIIDQNKSYRDYPIYKIHYTILVTFIKIEIKDQAKKDKQNQEIND